MTVQEKERYVPLGAASVRLRMNRERVLRRLQSGVIAGAQIGGRWFVDRAELPAEQLASA